MVLSPFYFFFFAKPWVLEFIFLPWLLPDALAELNPGEVVLVAGRRAWDARYPET